ncbi:hypothetical protein M0802_000131 [Mischocyttarus mexicanus]|nr:hypothetical protein M0802_000131 [Mischocyttarus mexicanus]
MTHQRWHSPRHHLDIIVIAFSKNPASHGKTGHVTRAVTPLRKSKCHDDDDRIRESKRFRLVLGLVGTGGGDGGDGVQV